MFKKFALAPAVVAMTCLWAAQPSIAQTFADQVRTIEAQIELAQKQRQLQDLLGEDTILTKLPQVVAVMAFGGETKARLMLKSGVTLTYGENEVINQRLRVVAITPREVVVAVTPAAGSKGAKGKKAPDPVLMPLEFIAGAAQSAGLTGQQMQGQGLPGTPGTPVQSGPIPEALRQAPPAVPAGNLATWPDGARPQAEPPRENRANGPQQSANLQ